MVNVSNGRCVRRLGVRCMSAARTRNIIAVLAIALTTVLFTSLFTIAASINYSFQQENFRQAGGDFHGTIKELTREQLEELRTDPLIKEDFARMFVGMPSDLPFNKAHVEVSYLEPGATPHYFCAPEQGSLPREGTDEAATDTRVLALLGVKPEIGAQFTMSFYIDENTMYPQLVTRTFTLSGWWTYDSAVVASHVLLPLTAAEEICALSSGAEGTSTGVWNLDMMFKNAMSIREDVVTVLENHGYQNEDTAKENYLKIGVNWGYSGAQLSQNFDAGTLIAIAAVVLLIIFTGYLIIYNVFQISVSNDIRFYGLLKTIGTTGRQLKRIIRQQALLLSLIGIPIGLVLGFLIGNRLTPVIMAQLSYKNVFVSFNPWIFIGAALFALITVFISCAKPGRMAARVSPVEAVRYAEGGASDGKRKERAAKKGASLPSMAWANLGRSGGKTAVTVISLTLAVVLLTVTYTFSLGFDMNKYLATKADVDFILGSATYFQTSSTFIGEEDSVTEDIIADVNERGGVTGSGRIYGHYGGIDQFVPEDWFRAAWSRWNPEEIVDMLVDDAERIGDGLLADRVSIYGMDDFPLSLLDVLDGDLEPLKDPTQNAIAAVYLTDDYNSTEWGSHYAKLGDTVTMRYIEELEYFWKDTGEIIGDLDMAYESDRPWSTRAKVYEDVEYTVCALVNIPNSISYRYWGADQFVMGAEQFIQDSGTSSVMTYIFNTEDGSEDAMEDFLAGYTESVQPLYDYESRKVYEAEFEGFRGMFMTLGGALSLIIGLVGVLNFINAVLTGILTRKRELAVLQSIGMTGGQLKSMLMYEGLYYTLLSLAASAVIAVCAGPLMGQALNSVFWFFTYRFTAMPLLIVLPVFLLLGAVTPLLVYRSVAKHTIVERLRETEG